MNEAERLKTFWDRRYADFTLAESGIKTLSPAYSRLLYRCKKNAYLKATSRAGFTASQAPAILDGGCGQGFFAGVVEAEFPRASYTGLDISEKAIAFLRPRFPRYTWMQCDMGQAGLSLGQAFDLAQSIEVLHLLIDDRHQAEAIANIAAHLKPGGTLILTDTLPPERYAANEYIVFRPLEYYRQLLKRLNVAITAVFPMYYCIPDMGPGTPRIRARLRRVPPRLMYLFDRAALALRLPQWGASHDSRMKMLLCRKAA